VLLASLWLPWYALQIPQALRDVFKGFGQGAANQPPRPGTGDGFAQAFSGMLSGLADAIPDEVTVKGWTALDGADVVLAVISVAALALALSLGGSGVVRMAATDASRATAALGAIALAIVGYHIVSPPGGDAPAIFGEDLVKVRYGLIVAALGALAMLAGGLMARSAAAAEPVAFTPAFEPPAEYPSAPQAPEAAGSAAPPGWAPPAA